MSIKKRLMFFPNLLWCRLRGKARPLSVLLNITDKCNLKCKYCYAQYPDRCRKDPSFKQLITLFGEFKKLGTRRVSITGGEPLCRKDFPEVIDALVNRGFDVTVNTNGILVPKYIDKLKRVDVLCISIDGPEDVHDAMRGQGSHRAALKGLQVASKAGIKIITNTVLTRSNPGAIVYMLDLAKKTKVVCEFNIALGVRNPYSNVIEHAFKLGNRETRDLLLRIAEMKKSGAPIYFSADAYLEAAKWENYRIERKKTGETMNSDVCFAGIYSCFIDTNGLCYPCTHIVDNFYAMNVYAVGFTEAFRHLAKKECVSCYMVDHKEQNLVFSLSLKGIINQAKEAIR